MDMNQRAVISDFVDKERMKMNPALFTRSDDEICRELENVITSCQRDNMYFTIRVDSFQVVDDYNEIRQILFNYYDHLYRNKSKSKKKDNPYEFIDLNYSDIKLLIVNYYIEAKNERINPENIEKYGDPNHLTVYIAVPRIIDKYYFRINGIMRSTLYQIVDGSTYNNSTSNAKTPSVTLKIIFMAVRIFREYVDMITTTGEVVKANHYKARIFNKTISAMEYFLAQYGFYGAIEFLGLREIYVSAYDPQNPSLYTFQIGEDKFLSVARYIFDADFVTRSFIVCVSKCIIHNMPLDAIFTREYWVKYLGSEFSGMTAKVDKRIKKKVQSDNRNYENYVDTDPSAPNLLEKGYSILDSFTSIYDIGTKESIRLPEEDKSDMFRIFRWMIREFNNLRMKDNLDISIKKIRFAEYVASLYAMKVARGIYRIADKNKRVTTEDIRKAIRTDPMRLLFDVSKCGMVTYRNIVTDMDSFIALKFTYKGVSGLGESNSQSIPVIYRSIHHSHVGRVDLDSSSDGNPGITGTICPFVELYDGFFSDYEEPNIWKTEFLKTFDAYKKATGLKEALIFEDRILSIDKKEQIEVAGEVIATMKQIIKPYLDSDGGEIMTFTAGGQEDV